MEQQQQAIEWNGIKQIRIFVLFTIFFIYIYIRIIEPHTRTFIKHIAIYMHNFKVKQFRLNMGDRFFFFFDFTRSLIILENFFYFLYFFSMMHMLLEFYVI